MCLETFEMWCWRKMEKLTLIDVVTNEEVLGRTGERKTILDTVLQRKAKEMAEIPSRCDPNPTAEERCATNTEENGVTDSSKDINILYIHIKTVISHIKADMDALKLAVRNLSKDMDRSRSVNISNHELEKDLVKQTSEIEKSQKVVSGVQEWVPQEQEERPSLCDVNEKLKVQMRNQSTKRKNMDVTPGPRSLNSSSVHQKVPRIMAVAVEHQESDEDDEDVSSLDDLDEKRGLSDGELAVVCEISDISENDDVSSLDDLDEKSGLSDGELAVVCEISDISENDDVSSLDDLDEKRGLSDGQLAVVCEISDISENDDVSSLDDLEKKRGLSDGEVTVVCKISDISENDDVSSLDDLEKKRGLSDGEVTVVCKISDISENEEMAELPSRYDPNPTAEERSDTNTEEDGVIDSTRETYIPYIKKALMQLKPSQELRYYRKKMDDLAEDVECLYKDIDRCQSVCLRNHELEKDLVKQTSEIAKLQRLVSELQESLSEEREQVLYLYAENEKMKIWNREQRRLTVMLLSNSDVTTGPRSLSSCRSSSVPRKVPRVMAVEHEESDEDNDKDQETQQEGCSHPSDRYSCLKLLKTIKQLKEEYTEHLHCISADKDIICSEGDRVREKLENEVCFLSDRLKESNDELAKSVKAHMQCKEASRLREVAFLAELEYMRSLKQMPEGQANGRGNSHTLPGGGTDSTYRQNIDVSSLLSEINFLKAELAQKNNLIEKYQNDCVALQDELAEERSNSKKMKKLYKDNISKAIAHIDHHKNDYRNLEYRRLMELRGFHNSIKLIRTRLAYLERHNRQVNHSLLKLVKPPVVHSKKRTSSVNSTIASSDDLAKGIREASKKIDEVEAALNSSV